MNVTVSHKKNKLAVKNINYEFTTGNEPPKGGDASMIPLTGLFAKTNFTFSISNWVVPKVKNMTSMA